jgi:hypothetical protein
MTREQFEKLKKGSIIKSRGNRKRYVMMKSNNGYIRLRKLSYDRGYPHDYVGYLYSDICRGYKIVKY